MGGTDVDARPAGEDGCEQGFFQACLCVLLQLGCSEPKDGKVDKLEWLCHCLVSFNKVSRAEIDVLMAKFDLMDVGKDGVLGESEIEVQLDSVAMSRVFHFNFFGLHFAAY